MILGPLAGSLLFKLGGYALPFYVMAGLLLLAAIAAFVALEADDEIVRSGYSNMDGEEIAEEFEDEFPLRKVVGRLLSNGLFLIPNILMVPVWSCMDFAMPFIGPHLEECGATSDKIVVGSLFISLALSYMLSSMLWGYLVGHFRCSRYQ